MTSTKTQVLQFQMTESDTARLLELLNKSQNQENNPDDQELMTQAETAKFLNLSRVGLWSWRKQGKLPFYRMGRRVYFKRSEIIEAMKKVDLSSFTTKGTGHEH